MTSVYHGRFEAWLKAGRTGVLATACLAVWVTAPSALSAELDQPLFVIERSINANVVHYDARLTPDGRLDPNQPIVAYWVMAAEDGRREDLTVFEKLKAYGLTIQPDLAADSYRVRLAAEKSREIHVYRQGNTVRAETTIAGRRAYLEKIYVSTHRAVIFNFPSSVELFGTDIATGEPRREILSAAH